MPLFRMTTRTWTFALLSCILAGLFCFVSCVPPGGANAFVTFHVDNRLVSVPSVSHHLSFMTTGSGRPVFKSHTAFEVHIIRKGPSSFQFAHFWRIVWRFRVRSHDAKSLCCAGGKGARSGGPVGILFHACPGFLTECA